MDTILFTHNIPREGLEEILNTCVVLFPPEGKYAFSEEELAFNVQEADAIFAAGPISRRVITAGTRLKVIGNYGAGYDKIDTIAAAEWNIPVTNLTESTALPTAEVALALLLSLYRRIPELDELLHNGRGKEVFGMGKAMGRTLKGETLGIVGMGNIGQKMALLCHTLGMEILYTQRSLLPVNTLPFPATYLPVKDMLPRCGALSLHLPYTPETHHWLNREKLSLLPQRAVVINTARGGVLDTVALAEALKNNRLAGAGLDVFPNEPDIPEILLDCPHTVFTPHIGTNTAISRREMAAETADCILRILRGMPPRNIVNGVLPVKQKF